MTMGAQTVCEDGGEVPVHATADVVVAGGGPAGLGAAVAAARAGADTLLIERYGILGGMATSGLITSLLGHNAGKGRPAVEGVCREWVERMHALGGAPAWEEGLQGWGIRFDPEACKFASDRMVQESGARLLLHSLVCGVVMDGPRLDAVLLETKQGRLAVRGKVFVDATGDADIVFRAGLPLTLGRSFDGRPMAMGSMFRIRDVDPSCAERMDEVRQSVRQARESGHIRVYGGVHLPDEDGLMSLNVTRCAGDGTRVEDLTRAELQVREDTWDIVRFYRRNLPGFGACRLDRTPAHVGVRETRQALGDYVMTADDVLECRKHPDGIARSSYWIDIHCPYGYTWPAHVCQPECPMGEGCEILREAPEQLPRAIHPPEGQWADVPYRSLTVRGAENLLTAGRCISANHHAMGAIRVMAICMAIGQGAGTAAAMAADLADGRVRDVDAAALRAGLSAAGALV